MTRKPVTPRYKRRGPKKVCYAIKKDGGSHHCHLRAGHKEPHQCYYCFYMWPVRQSKRKGKK